MSRVSGKTVKTVAALVTVVFLLSITFFVVQGNRRPSAAPSTQVPAVKQVNGKIESGMWTDARVAQWLRSKELIKPQDQAFLIMQADIPLDTPMPISLDYYDLEAITKSPYYDPSATSSMPSPTHTLVSYYDGSTNLTVSFPPSDAPQTCRYLVVLFVGFKSKASETPKAGTLTSASQRVLGVANQDSNQELRKRC